MYSFPNLELVHCSTSSSNCCFLTLIQISQEAGKVVWYLHLLNNFPQFVVIHTVKDFSAVNEAEVDVFSGILLLFQWSSGFGNLISGSPAFPKSSLNSFRVATFYLLPIWGMSSLSFFLPSLLSLILNKDNWASSMCHMIYYRLSA